MSTKLHVLLWPWPRLLLPFSNPTNKLLGRAATDCVIAVCRPCLWWRLPCVCFFGRNMAISARVLRA